MDFLKGLFGSGQSEEPEQPEARAPRALPPGPAGSMPPPPMLHSRPPPSRSGPLDLLGDGPPDFNAVLERAGVTNEQRSRVGKAQDLLKTLPSGAAPAVKRQIVEAAFKAFDIPTHEIIRAASAEIEALTAFVASGEAVKQKAVEQGNQRVAELEKQIAEVRTQTDQSVFAQEAREVATRKEIARIEPVLKFFVREAIAAVVAENGPGSHPPMSSPVLDVSDMVESVRPEALDIPPPPPGLGR